MNKIQGYGVYHWPNDEKYEGNWMCFRMHGEGKIYKTNGEIIPIQSYNGVVVSGTYDKEILANHQAPRQSFAP